MKEISVTWALTATAGIPADGRFTAAQREPALFYQGECKPLQRVSFRVCALFSWCPPLLLPSPVGTPHYVLSGSA